MGQSDDVFDPGYTVTVYAAPPVETPYVPGIVITREDLEFSPIISSVNPATTLSEEELVGELLSRVVQKKISKESISLLVLALKRRVRRKAGK